MSPIFELEEEVQTRHEAPRLLVQWSSRWEEFVGSIKPALSRSEARLAGEAPFGLVPFRIMLPSYVIEAFVILAALFIKVKVDELRPYVVPRITSHDVIYYSGDELPRTEDLGGAESGRTGEAGGQEAHHRTQTIKVARGGSLVPQVVDAPNLKLPASTNAVANLLAIKPDPGPPPAEGMRSTRSAPNVTTTLVAPSPNVIHDYTRNGIRLDPVMAPPTSVTRDRPLTAPTFSPTVAPPAPSVSSNHALVAPALVPAVVPPSPTVSRDHPLAAPTLDPAVAPPATNLKRDPFRAAPALEANVAAPAPSAISRQLSAAPVQSMDPAVAPPPVSAPERASVHTPKMSLPAPAVAAPPPSSDISSDMRRLSAGTVPDPGKAVAPPPPSPQASGTLMGSLLGRIFGPSEVAAPPPTSINGNAGSNGSRPALTPSVTPPPATLSSTDAGGNVRGNRNGTGATLGSNVVAPPPSTRLSGGTGTSRPAAPYNGNPSVVAPPPSLGGNGGGTGKTGGSAGAPGGRLLADNVAPTPPSIGDSSGSAASGLGRKGPGLGAPLDPGSGLAPPTSAGSGKDAGTVMSTQPGTKIGVPPNAAKGSLGMSPAGGEKPGLGSSGGGSSIGHGTGPGSGMSGSDSGAGKTGTGHGSDPNSHGGISPANGPGGAGNIPAGTSAVPGVAISGGSTSNIITLPSFGSDSAGNDPSTPGRSSLKKQGKGTLQADVVGGSPFEAYKKLLGGETHTTWIDTTVGTVSMFYSDESKVSQGFRATLAPPSALQNDLPDGLPHARMVVACTLDAEGNIKNPRVLEAGPAQMTAKILAALRNWKFQPAMRNNQPVAVTAILGFGIDTNDRF